MVTHGPNRIEKILQKAVEIVNPAERAAYLEQACGGDGALRSEIDSLLRAHEEAGTFLDMPAIDPEVIFANASSMEGPGTVIGRYTLLEKTGEGGMATVYVAEQEQPIRRKVALKIIKLGMDTKQVIARFEVERQALAMMDHPNIAKVFDGGATETGRPYFVMELVEGVPITDYCDEHNLSTRERLELFVQVCHAVQHAHQKGIIHRNIKPSNVLVTVCDDVAVPKVIDFGIAKATNQRLTEKTVFTRLAQMIGTPEYMSPEQAGASDLDVDTRADVYSLGVLLYQLLTGATPFDGSQLRQAGYAGIQRIIRETDPVKPSTKLGSLGQTLAEIAQHRQTTPETLSKSIRGDLDWIVMKTLEKDRARRYETAHALAEDVTRHLRHEPIEAGKPGPFVRCKKFVQRHRALVTGTVAVLIVLCAGIVVSTYFAVSYRQTLRQLQEAEAARKKLENDRRLSVAQRLYAEGRYAEALTEIESYMEREDTTPEAHLLRARVLVAMNRLNDAVKELEPLATEAPEIAAAAHHLLWLTHAGDRPGLAEEHRRLSESLLPKTPEAYCLRATAAQTVAETVGWLSEALTLEPACFPARKARALAYYGLKDFANMEQDAEKLVVLRPQDSLGYSLRALARRARGQFAEAIEDHSRAIDFCDAPSSLAELHDQRRITLALAGDHLRELIDAKRCADLEPGRRDYQFNVLASLVSLHDYEGAAKGYDALAKADPTCESELIEQATKYAFNTLGAKQELDIPQVCWTCPFLCAIKEASEQYLSLARKAARAVPYAGAHMCWSPDGKELAYGRTGLTVSELETQREVVPTIFEASGIEVTELESGTTRLLTTFGNDPSWSSDGRFIAFAHKPDETAAEEVWIVNATGGPPRFLALGGWPTWAANPQRLFFHSRTEGALCTIDVANSDAKPQIVVACPDGFPAVSQDGHFFVYKADGEIRLAEVPSGAVLKRWQPPGPPNAYWIALSPDGKELCLGGDPAFDLGLWILNVETDKFRQIIDGPALRGVWSPDRCQMSILVGAGWGEEIWVATLDPNKPTCDCLTPARTWREYIQSSCKRSCELVTRCPAEAERHLSRLSTVARHEYAAGRYEEAQLLLETTSGLREADAAPGPRIAETVLLAKALYHLGRHDEAGAIVAGLWQQVRRGRLVQGQRYLWDAEKLLVAEDDRLSRLWDDLEKGRLADVTNALVSPQSENSQSTYLRERAECLRCVLATKCCSCAQRQAIDSNAVANYEAAIAVDPNYAPAFRDLAWLQATSLDPMVHSCAKALENVMRACALSAWQDHEFVATAAAISAAAGDFETAQEWQRLAITLLDGDEQEVWEDRYLEALRQYRSQRYDQASRLWQPLAGSLVGWWMFDEGQGVAAYDAVGGNHGILHNMAPDAWTDGVDGFALHFDGVDDYVEVSRPVEDDFTIAFWVKTDEASGGGDWWGGEGLVDADAAFEGQQDFGTALVGDKFAFGVGGGETLIDRTILSETAINDNQWHHVAATRDAIAGEMAVFVDGRQEATIIGPVGSKAGSAKMRFGSTQIPGLSYEKWRFFQGTIDDIRIWNQVLSINQMTTVPRASRTRTKIPGLVGYWPGNGNAYDIVGGNHVKSAGAADLAFAPGRVGQAFHFHNGQMGFVRTVGIGDLKHLTMALWVKLDSMPAGEDRSFLCIGPEKAVLRYEGEAGAGTLHYYTKDTGGTLHHIRVDNALEEGVYHHAAGTYDGNTMRLYLDGTEIGTCETPGLLGTEDNDGVVFGQEDLKGLLDEIQIYNRALSGAEMTALANENWVPVATLRPQSGHASDTRIIGDGEQVDHGAAEGAGSPVSTPVSRGRSEPETGDCALAPAGNTEGLQQFSIAFWVKLNSMPEGKIQRFVTLVGEKAVLRHDGQVGPGQLHFCMRMTDRTWGDIRIDNALVTGVYYHIVGTYDGHAMRLYLDGVQVGKYTPTGLAVRGEGIDLGGAGEPLLGLLDEVQIYDRALSAREVQGLYSNDGVPVAADGVGPISWWRLDETSGTIAHDCVGSNDGTVYGATWTAEGKVGGALRFGRKDAAKTR